MSIAVKVLHVLICVVLIGGVLLQSGNDAGLSGSIAGGAEAVLGKKKGRGIDQTLDKLTTVVAIIFMITSIILVAVV